MTTDYELPLKMNDKERLRWVDQAKGLGILLVVIGHVERGLINAGIAQAGGWLQLTDDWLYSFHMPLFFWLSGLFAARRINDTWKGFLSLRFRTVLYPYLIWAILQTLVQIAMSRSTNSQASLKDLLSIPYSPPAQFWFLYTLFLVSCMQQALFRTLKRASMVFGASMMLYLFSSLLVPSDVLPPIRSTFQYMIYFSGGAAMAPYVSTMQRLPSWLKIGMGIACLFIVSAFCTTASSFYLIPLLASLGVAGSVLACHAISFVRPFDFLAGWGRASLQIYAAHILASSGFRIILKTLGATNLTLHLVGGIAVGIAFPLFLNWGGKRIGFPYLFSLKKVTSDSYSFEKRS